MSLKFKEAMETCESEKPNHGAFQRSCCSEKLKFRRQRRQANDALFAELTSSFAVPLKVRVVLDVEYEYKLARINATFGTFVGSTKVLSKVRKYESTKVLSYESTFVPSKVPSGVSMCAT